MKRLLYFFAFFLLLQCKNEPYKKDSTGPKNTLTVVCEDHVFEELKDFLRSPEILGEPYPGLIRPEPKLAIRHFSPKTFANFPATRNVLHLKKGDPSITWVIDSLAKPQNFIKLKGHSLADLKKIIQNHRDKILQSALFTEATFQKNYLSRAHLSSWEALKPLGVDSIKITNNFRLSKADSTFAYYRRDQKQDIVNLCFFNIEALNEDVSTKINAFFKTKLTDAHGRYPALEPKLPLLREKLEEGSHYEIFEHRGFWVMKGDVMGGPVLIKEIKNKVNKRTFYALGFMYAPHTPPLMNKKRDYLTELELIFGSIKLK